MKPINFTRLLSASACVLTAGIFSTLPISAQTVPNGSRVLAQAGTMTPPSGVTPSPSSPAGTQLSEADRQFMMKAAQSDMTEIATSQLALARSSDDMVRQFAQQMITQHSNSTAQLQRVAAMKGVSLPKDAGPENNALIAALARLNDAAFDRAYMNAQVMAHAKTNADYQAEIQQGQDQDVVAFARQVQPIVASHLQMAQTMVASR